MDARSVYYGSNGGASRSFCAKLEKNGHLGRIAAQLFRVQKASSRAKVYRGGIKRSGGRRQSFKNLTYQRKDECIERLCDLLVADSCAMKWGWKVDAKQSFANNLLYVDLPNGQVSFHAINRCVGPDYDGDWDKANAASESRIVAFCQLVFDEGRD